MACGRPLEFGVSDRKLWTLTSLRDCFVAKHPEAGPISRTSVYRILTSGELTPHRMRVWLHSPDPKFRERVTEICELYLHPPKDSIVLCFDEKPGMQALGRKHSTKQPKVRQVGRFEFEYVRHGTRVLLAAFNPQTGEVYSEVRRRRTAVDLVQFMEALARKLPKKTIHIIWDNLNIHYDGKDRRWTEFNRRHGGRFHFHYTPKHASWVNQVEIFFSILQRRVLRYGVHNSPRELEADVVGFIDLWNRTERHPFRWKFAGYPKPARRAA